VVEGDLKELLDARAHKVKTVHKVQQVLVHKDVRVYKVPVAKEAKEFKVETVRLLHKVPRESRVYKERVVKV
jgi:hypothetical protein